jgi:hypothetical protein
VSPDPLQQTWQTQTAAGSTRWTSDHLLQEVRRNEHWFAAMIWWRDLREIGVSLVLIPIWIAMGNAGSLPWTWYLTIPALVWIAGFMAVDRVRQRRHEPDPSEPLERCLRSSLAQVEHQIWLLKNVAWWYLLPIVVSTLAFIGQVAWRDRSGGPAVWLSASGPAAVVGVVFFAIYRLNQAAVRNLLEPRRLELQALLASLGSAEAPGAQGH